MYTETVIISTMDNNTSKETNNVCMCSTQISWLYTCNAYTDMTNIMVDIDSYSHIKSELVNACSYVAT